MKGSQVPHRALVYGDVDLNLIDGSAVWAQSVTQALAAAGCEVTLVLKSPVRTSRLIGPLDALPGVTVRRTHEERIVPDISRGGLTPDQARRALLAVDSAARHDLVVVRGRRAAVALAEEPAFAGRLWTYLTDVPQSVGRMDDRAVAELTAIADASRLLLCQTEELRGFLEQTVPAVCGKCVLFPPVVPAVTAQPRTAPRAAETLRLVYSGKFAARWNTYEMTDLPRLLRDRGVPGELHMVGDKIHDEPGDPGFESRMRRALESAPGLVWHGGVAREEALSIADGADVGLGWRHPDMDASLELSTKVLEFGALGMPVVLNRTPMHERLLGVDYPLFAGDDIADVLEAAARDTETYALAAERCHTAARDFALDRAAERLRGYLRRTLPDPVASADRPVRVVFAGHDLKFLTRLLDHLRDVPGMEVRLDEWSGLNTHDEEASRAAAAWADVVVCEWCGPNAVWYARHKRPGQRLLVRLHRFELYAAWPYELDISAIDRVICVSDHYTELTRERTGWPAEKVITVPNWVDVDQLDRPKLPGARFQLGMIGIAPSRKRLDLGMEVLAHLRRRDPRYTLRVKSKLPWEYWWIWKKPEERMHYEAALRRARGDLSGAVVFDPYGPDVANWLRRVGFVLSTSDDESFHLAPAEGMASSAVPALLNWPGADRIYAPRWVHDSPEALADSIAATTPTPTWTKTSAEARSEVQENYALPKVATEWTTLLTTT
ncbi:MAG TPA: glycosyltransferase family 1 protein [Streptosporangiaceae bacterium]|jgi:glycosyltransferase involved in cell wall biosynthesis